MSKTKPKVTICRTCVRDNYGEGLFSEIDLVEKAYRERLKTGVTGSAAEIVLQNCFTECENFHCVQVESDAAGFRLKKISSVEKIDQVADWIRDIHRTGRLDLPDNLISNLIEPVKVSK